MDGTQTIADFSITGLQPRSDPRASSRVPPTAPGAVPEAARPSVTVEIVPLSGMVTHQLAWQDLCERAIERNVFLEPAFALPLVQHSEHGRRPAFLLVWDTAGAAIDGRLLGLCPISPPRFPAVGIVQGPHGEQVRLGTPLVDRDRAAEVVDALFEGIRGRWPGAAALRLVDLTVEGPFAVLLKARCADTGRGVRCFAAHRRAVLLAAPEATTNVMPFSQARRRKEIGRQRRRLSERGSRVYTSARTQEEVAQAAERFLALEHRGWKGDRGTALLGRPALATFTRSMVRLMAFEGKCRIDAIEIDGAPIAMGIVLTVGDRAHFWKTTFHEDFAPLSPGVQFALELTERQLADRSVTLTDSCAVPDHPMIDRLWPDRMMVADVMIALDPSAPGKFRGACAREIVARALRAQAKRLYRFVRRGGRASR